jgi:putative drug exporter of the RND superfamily
MPLLTALAGVAVSVLTLQGLAAALSISNTAVTLAVMIGLAVGIDYALFILSRHRAQLATGVTPAESAATAVGTAGTAVVFAGSTVIIALAALSVVGIPFLTVMGLAAAGTVLTAVLIATTLLPAIFGFAGTRLTPRPGSRAARLASRTGHAGGPGRARPAHGALAGGGHPASRRGPDSCGRGAARAGRAGARIEAGAAGQRLGRQRHLPADRVRHHQQRLRPRL